ncbi:MAG: PHP domain-containing protein [Armatimonadetes bacterium]|nr:PHP domain-containing protein [Armatimonadota bacterium]
MYAADLHLHSVLSPCGDLAMSPSAIVARAQAVGLDLIALTDHNMAENGAALRTVAARTGLAALYGMELETVEEVHLLCLFDHLEQAMAWQAFVYPRLPAVPNDPDRFGEQVVVNDQEEILRFETRLLANAAAVTLSEACAAVAARGGLAIPAHIDRPAHSLVSQLGFPPAGLKLEAVEVTRFMAANFLAAHRSWLAALPLVRFSDAHFLEDIGAQRTLFQIEAPTVAEIRLALRGEAGRAIAGYG